MRYNTVILGSGYFSLGYAMSHPDTLIIERSQLLDPNFGGTLSGFSSRAEDQNGIGTPSPLKTHFTENGFLRDGAIHINLSEIAISSFFSNKPLPVLLNTEITSVRHGDNGFSITFQSVDGITEIEADEVIDTRDGGEKNILNVLCKYTGEKTVYFPEYAGFTVSNRPAFFPDETVLRFCFSRKTDCNTAKAEVMRYFESFGKALGVKPIKFAYRTFSDGRNRKITENGITKINELSLGDPIEAFEYGRKMPRRTGSALPDEATDRQREAETLDCDILCVGAGAAGCYAAIAASREGARVILLEKDLNVGGMPVNGQVNGFYYGESGGSYESVEKRCAELCRLFFYKGKHTDALQTALTETIAKSGAVLLTESSVEALRITDNRLHGALINTPDGKKEIRFSLLIDATSDGHIVRMCPQIKTYLGRDADGTTAPFTVRTEIMKDGKCYYYNGDDGYCNQYLQPECTEKTVRARARRLELAKSDSPRIISIATTAGFREGIRYEGEETLSYVDIIMGKNPEKTLFVARSDLDKHGHDHALDDELYQSWWIISNLATVTARINVPMGAVVPKGIKGIVTAGRCLSVDSYASGAVRMNRDMHRMGECVGIAAALAARDGVDFTRIDYSEYCALTDKYRCRNGLLTDRFAFDSPNGTAPYRRVCFDMTEEEIISVLATDSPGEAIWACYLTDGRMADKLIPLLESEDSTFTLNVAFALGIMGRKEALPRLRKAILSRDTDFLRGCRRSNQLKCTVALCLIGRLGEKSDIDILMPFFTEEEQKREIYSRPVDLLVSRGENYGYTLFQLFTFAITSVCRLAARHGAKKEVAEKLHELLTPERMRDIGLAVALGDPDSHMITALSGVVQKALSMIL